MRLARNIYHRKDGRFEARYANGKNSEGKTKYSSVFGKTYSEVKKKLEQAKAAVALPKSPSSVKSLIITEAVYNYIEKSEQRLKPSTIGVYRRYLNIHIAPYFNDIQCEALTAQLSQDFINKLIGKNKLAVSTAQSVFDLLKSSLKELSGDIFKVTFPKQPKRIVDFLSVDEQKRIEQTARNRCDSDYIAVMLCLYTGIRLGEVAGLRWSDISFERNFLRVNRTMQRIPSTGSTQTKIVFMPPKSTSSERIIPLPEFLLDILIKFKSSIKTESVISYKNKPIEPRTLQNRFKKTLKIAEVRNVCWHSMRHSFAVRALENGFDIKTLSEILGHSSAVVTLNKYAHSCLAHKKKCMNSLSAVYYSD